MNKISCLIITLCCLTFSGCGNLSPRLDNDINNSNGEIEELKNIQNGINLELGKLRQNDEITNSQLKDVQKGLLNFNARLSSNENSGIQILQGDGALILVFAIITIGMILKHYRDLYKKNEKAATILAQQIANKNDPDLEEVVFQAALYTDVEKEVYNLMTKNKHKNSE